MDLDNPRSSYMERLPCFPEHRNIELDIVASFAADNWAAGMGIYFSIRHLFTN